jgi:hypothetical protein
MDHEPMDHEGIDNDEDVLEDLHLAADFDELQIIYEGNQYLLQLLEELSQDPEFPWSFPFPHVMPTSIETYRDRCRKFIRWYCYRNGLLKMEKITRRNPSEAAAIEAVRFQSVEAMYKKYKRLKRHGSIRGPL